jgi:hypothetical protein
MGLRRVCEMSMLVRGASEGKAQIAREGREVPRLNMLGVVSASICSDRISTLGSLLTHHRTHAATSSAILKNDASG